MNEKIQFLTNTANQKQYIVLVPKEENAPIVYNFMKLNEDEKAPREYLASKKFDNALEGYLALKKEIRWTVQSVKNIGTTWAIKHCKRKILNQPPQFSK